MEATALDQWLFLIYFVYGLAFFGMGLAMALESGRSPSLAEARALRPLAAFGVVHGAHEWFESYLMQAETIPEPLPEWVPWMRLGTLAVSFTCLLLFAYRLKGGGLTEAARSWRHEHILLGCYGLALVLSSYMTYRTQPLPGIVFWDVMARYLLAVPASVLSTLALIQHSRRAEAESRPGLARLFAFAAIGFAIYGATQLFVHPLDMFPARVINQAMFIHYTGVPIPVVRTIVAGLIAYSLIRATQAVEDERHAQLFAMQQARLDALQQRDELRGKLLQHTVQAQEDERARIARELHDETAQVLSAFSLQLAALRSGLKRQPEARARVENLQELSRGVSQGLYRLVHDLRPAHLDDLGLMPALNYLLAEARSREGLEVALRVTGSACRLPLPVETVLFRVAQEAVTNIARHARTQQAQLEIQFGDEEVRLTVADQGLGFDTESPLPAPRGWGLEGMRERVEAAGGRFTLTSVRGCGTTVTAAIPLEARRAGSPREAAVEGPPGVPYEAPVTAGDQRS
ncbi:MAG: sensor histidine kinase [Bacteroidota bacterium]